MDNLPVKIFQKEQFGKVRVILKDGEPWFVARDIAEALGYARPSQAVQDHCKKVNKITQYPKSEQWQNVPPLNILIIPESDVYRLIMRSKLPAAEDFQDWICEEVIPSLRSKGSYSLDKDESLPFGLVDRLGAADVIASVLYKDTNQRVLFLDKIYFAETGQSALALAGVTLVAPTERQFFTPTEIGKWYDMSPRVINTMLEEFGLQKRISDKWEPTGKGISYGAVMLDTGKSHSDGTPVRQLKWDSQIKDFLDSHFNVTNKRIFDGSQIA